MKKLFIIVSAITAMAIAAPVMNAQAHNSARKIANAVRGANGPCTTPDGRQGTQYPSGSTVTTTTTNTNGYTNNSGSTSTSTSVSGNVGTSGIGASGSYGNTRTHLPQAQTPAPRPQPQPPRHISAYPTTDTPLIHPPSISDRRQNIGVVQLCRHAPRGTNRIAVHALIALQAL